jgi:Na+-transporting NADH:ubiquinone oxidoreductase subunit NqrB
MSFALEKIPVDSGALLGALLLLAVALLGMALPSDSSPLVCCLSLSLAAASLALVELTLELMLVATVAFWAVVLLAAAPAIALSFVVAAANAIGWTACPAGRAAETFCAPAVP